MLHRATGNAKVREVKNRQWPLHAYIVAHVVNTFLPLRESYRSSNTSLPTRTLRLRPSKGGVMKKCSQIFIIICVFNWEMVTQFTCVRGSAWSRIPCMVRFPINGITIEYTEIKMSLGLLVNYRTDHSWITGQKMFFFFFWPLFQWNSHLICIFLHVTHSFLRVVDRYPVFQLLDAFVVVYAYDNLQNKAPFPYTIEYGFR